MKKLVLKLSVLVMILTLVTLPLVSGTYAKYTTTDSATDTARVAKWGVTVAVTGNAFAESYITNITNGDITVSSSTEDVDNLVAPGTSGTFGGVDITGIPEVAVNITKTADLTLTGWTLDGNVEGTFYCPIVITVNETNFYGLSYTSPAAFEEVVEDAIEDANGNYVANTVLSGSLIVGLNGDYSWSWAFTGAAGSFSDSPDVALVAGKTYYTTDESGITFTPVAVLDLDVDDITTYYERTQNNADDTAIGMLGTAPTITLAVSATVTQIDTISP